MWNVLYSIYFLAVLKSKTNNIISFVHKEVKHVLPSLPDFLSAGDDLLLWKDKDAGRTLPQLRCVYKASFNGGKVVIGSSSSRIYRRNYFKISYLEKVSGE